MLAMGLSYYKWYQNQSLGGVPVKTLGFEGGWIVRSHIKREASASEDAL